MLNAVLMVEAVELFEAVKRIPDSLRGFTFFSAHDRWLYHTEDDTKVCRDCSMYDDATFTGEDLRRLLPYLDIVGADKIMVNIHLNCRCWLSREET